MARALRIEYEGAFYHVTSRGNERRRIFFSKSDYEQFKSYLRESEQKYGHHLHCYVLMSNHYHLVIETPRGNLSTLMHYLNSSYTNYINRKRNRSGHLFQGRYKAIVIDKDSYLLELSRYIHLNPVRAGISETPQAHTYSSYRSYISRDHEDIVHRDLLWAMISNDTRDAPGRYRTFVEEALGKDHKSPLKNTYGGAILGGKAFIRDVLGRFDAEILNRDDISGRRQLRAPFGAGELINMVSHHIGMSVDELKEKRGDPRNMTIYLLKTYTDMNNRHIGELFGGLSYSAVAKVNERFIAKVKKDRKLRSRLAAFSKILSVVKG
jgi:putative transposase